MKNIHEGHFSEDPIHVESASYEGRVYPCSCGMAFVGKDELDEHLAKERALAGIKALFNAIRAQLEENTLARMEENDRDWSANTRPV